MPSASARSSAASAKSADGRWSRFSISLKSSESTALTSCARSSSSGEREKNSSRRRSQPSRVREQRKPDHLVQQPRADVGVPLGVAGGDFAEVEADDAFFCADDCAQDADRFVPREAAGNGSAGAGAEGGIEAVEVEDAQAGIFFGVRADGAEGNGVIAA